jgi:hypothetical protein
MYSEKVWEYKGYIAEFELDFEPDNVKIFHYVTTPTGERHMLGNISPYDDSEESVNNAIEYHIKNGEFEPYRPTPSYLAQKAFLENEMKNHLDKYKNIL